MSILSDTLRELEKLHSEQQSVEDALIDLFEGILEMDVRPRATPGAYAVGTVLDNSIDPIVPMSVILMIDDICHSMHNRLSSNQQLQKRLAGLLESDEQLVVAAILDILTPLLGVPPVCIVTALIVKIGYKKFLGIDQTGPHYDKGIARKVLAPYLPKKGTDQFEVSLFAARLHRKTGNRDQCERRLTECEDLCRQKCSLSQLNSIGYEYIEMGDIERGRKLVSESILASPNDPGALDSLAWADYQLGDIDAALRHITNALTNESGIIRKYNEDALAEILYHGVLIARAAHKKQLEETYMSRLAVYDDENKWRSKL